MKKMTGMKGKNDCNCKCREYWTTKCSVEMKNDCRQMYTHRECKKVPVKKPMRVKEVECQKCVRYPELRSKTVTKRWVYECLFIMLKNTNNKGHCSLKYIFDIVF